MQNGLARFYARGSNTAIDLGPFAWRPPFIVQDATSCRWRQMQTSPAECLSDLALSHGGTKQLQRLDDLAHEFRKTVDGRAELNECRRTIFVEAFHPTGDRGLSDVKGPCGGRERPAASGTEFENRHPLG